MSSLHPREQIPDTCPACGHQVIEVTEPYVPSKPGMMATDKQWMLRHADPEAECDCDCAMAEPAVNHPPHACLACSETILRNEREIMVPVKPFGRRYRHADDDGCRRAMTQDYGSRIVSGGLVRGQR